MRVRGSGFDRLSGHDRGPLGLLGLVAPRRGRGILDLDQNRDFHRHAIGRLRVGPIFLGVEYTGEAQNGVILISGGVGVPWVLDQPVPASYGLAIGFDLSEARGTVAEQPRRLGQILLRLRPPGAR